MNRNYRRVYLTSFFLNRCTDGMYLYIQNGRWNGLMGALANRRVDMVMTSLTINAEREYAADFTIPFMETGIAILVAKRTGIISPTAFLGVSIKSLTVFFFSFM